MIVTSTARARAEVDCARSEAVAPLVLTTPTAVVCTDAADQAATVTWSTLIDHLSWPSRSEPRYWSSRPGRGRRRARGRWLRGLQHR